MDGLTIEYGNMLTAAWRFEIAPVFQTIIFIVFFFKISIELEKAKSL